MSSEREWVSSGAGWVSSARLHTSICVLVQSDTGGHQSWSQRPEKPIKRSRWRRGLVWVAVDRAEAAKNFDSRERRHRPGGEQGTSGRAQERHAWRRPALMGTSAPALGTHAALPWVSGCTAIESRFPPGIRSRPFHMHSKWLARMPAHSRILPPLLDLLTGHIDGCLVRCAGSL